MQWLRNVVFLVLFTSLAACSSDPKADAQLYCDCVERTEGQNNRECLEILQELQDKYAFSPEDAEQLILEIQVCKKALEK